MNERELNRRIIDEVRGNAAWNGQTFSKGGYVAIFDGQVVAVTRRVEDTIAALRIIAPDPQRGVVTPAGRGPAGVESIRRGR